MKYTVEYCKNNKVAIQVNSEEEYKELKKILHISNYYEKGLCYRITINHSYFSRRYDYEEDGYEIITFQQFMQSQTKKLEEFTDKDVIHCPTEELANKICKLLHGNGFEWSSGYSYLERKLYFKDICYRVKKGEYCTFDYYENEGYTIYEAEDILALYETNNLEEYIVECNTVEECNIVASHIKGVDYDCLSVFRYVINSKIRGKDDTLYGSVPTNCSHLLVLTFKEFQEKFMNKTNIEQYYGKQFTDGKTIYTIEKYGVDSIKIVWSIDNLNKDWKIITNKVFLENLEKQIYTMLETKIIGYKAPYDLAEGMVKKGTIYKKVQEDDRFYAPEGKISKTTLPKEIVETWEAVLEDEFKVGDFVYVIKSQVGSFGAESKVGKLTTSINTQGLGEKEKKFKEKFNVLIEGGVWNIGKADVRKATQAEIDSLFTKTLTLSNGKEVIVKRGTVIAENTEVNVQDLNNLIKDWIIQMGKWTVVVIDITFNIGCWKNVKLIDIQNILLEVERQEELMKD